MPIEFEHVEKNSYLKSPTIRKAERIVVTGYAQMTPLGNTEETWKGLLNGNSGVKKFDVDNFRTSIAAPLPANYNAYRYLFPGDEGEKDGTARITAMSIHLAREAAKKAQLLNEDGIIDKNIDKRTVAGWISTGYGEQHGMIDVYKAIHNHPSGIRAGSKTIRPSQSLRLFPEEINGRTAMTLGISGWGGNTVEACATGLSNIVEGARLLKEGRASIVVAGGLEDVLTLHPETTMSVFTALRALSKRNDEPEKASRPFDIDRDGFVMGSGGGIMVLEELNHALDRGAPIFAEVFGFGKSMDGRKDQEKQSVTELDPERVAETIADAIRDPNSDSYRVPTVIFAHATSTSVGDELEAQAIKLVFMRKAHTIPIAAIKGNIGHSMGGAGSINAISAVQSIRSNEIPYILNLDIVDPNVQPHELDLVQYESRKMNIDSALAVAYGFGGYNNAILFGKYVY